MSTTEPGPTSASRTRPPDHAAGAAEAAVDRIRAARETAKQRRVAAKMAVKQLRERNREECRRLVERARTARQGHQNPWPDNRPPQPRVLNLFEAEPDVEAEAEDAARPSVTQRQTAPLTPQPQGPRPRTQQHHEVQLYDQGQPSQDQEYRQPPQGQTRQPEPRRTTDDDWSQESWLH